MFGLRVPLHHFIWFPLLPLNIGIKFTSHFFLGNWTLRNKIRDSPLCITIEVPLQKKNNNSENKCFFLKYICICAYYVCKIFFYDFQGDIKIIHSFSSKLIHEWEAGEYPGMSWKGQIELHLNPNYATSLIGQFTCVRLSSHSNKMKIISPPSGGLGDKIIIIIIK